MATDPLTITPTEPNSALAPQPGLFDGQMPMLEEPVENNLQTPAETTAAPVPAVNADQPEEVQVAGLGAILKGIIGKGDTTEAGRLDSVIDPLTTQGKVGRFTVIREANPEEVADFYEKVGKTEGAPSLTDAQRMQGIPTAEFNLQNIKGPDDLKATIDNVSEIWKEAGRKAGRGKITHEQTKAMAQGLGLGKVVDNLLNRKAGEVMNAEQIHASLQAITSSAVELTRLAKIAAGDPRQEDLLKFRQHLAFHAALQANMKGAQMEVARALGAFRIPRGAEGGVHARDMETILADYGGEKSVKDMAKAYLALPNQGSRNRFAAGAFSKIKDMWFEMWINGLLSSPHTHVINNFSNLVMQVIQIPERFIAGGIGATRQAMGSTSERVYMTETIADIIGFFQGIGDGFKLSYEAFKTEAPVRDLGSKIEAAQRRAITAENLGVDQESFAGKGIDFLGAALRLPGRALMAEDEFWKAVAFRRELNSLAVRRSLDMRREAKAMREKGATPEDIAKAGLAEKDIMGAVDDVLKGSNVDATNTAQEYARVSTFTNPVEGALGRGGAWLQSTILGRMMLPFFRTPVQLTNAFIDRSPYGFVRAWKNAKDPIKRDALLARASLGTSVMGYSMYKYSQGRITGSGPSDYTLRRQMEDIGWKRWSLVHPKVENPRWLQVGHRYILHPDDVEYQSYHRMEPVSMVLAISADVAERFRWPTASQEEMDEMMLSGVNVIFDYLKEQTFLQGMGNIAKLFELGSAQGNREAAKIIENFVGSAMPYSSLMSAIERQPMFGGDPTSPLIIADRNEPIGLRDFYAGLERMDAKLIWKENDGPVLKDRFGSPRFSKNARIHQLLLPPIISDLLGDSSEDIDADPVKTEIVRIGLPIKMPSRKISGVRLTAEEYDSFLTFASTPPPLKNKFTGKMEMQQSFYEQLKEVINSDSYKEAPLPEKQKIIQTMDTLYKSIAKTLLLEAPEFEEEFADLREKVRQQEEITNTLGRQVQ
tara:strand:+ start:3024 stop:6002 length:2979 start_codon:yes stop_codon:yes gene_type:complete